MALKSILVHVTNSEVSVARVESALALAMTHDAHLTGIGVRPVVQIPGYASTNIPDGVIQEVEARQDAADLAARDAFRDAAARAGWSDRSDWLLGEGRASEVVGLHARYADLTIIGQQPPSGPDATEDSFADLLVMRFGRPVLVLPHIGAKKPIGKHIVVAWNASREAARAVGDAMPLLERSDKVDVMSVANQIDPGDVLLNYVADNGANLMVMCAYGHSRVREMIPDGVTRHMLEHMTVPVLMSH